MAHKHCRILLVARLSPLYFRFPDLNTYCSQLRIDPDLGGARITHIQARKSRRLPFLHEYILVFFAISKSQRFVLRIDRLDKYGSTSVGWRQDITPNTAIQEIGVYHVQDAQSGIDSSDGAWFAMDDRWGSDPIAAKGRVRSVYHIMCRRRRCIVRRVHG